MKRLRFLLFAGLLVPVGACSLLYDTDPYRHGSPAGVPTLPTVSITPASPTTLDDLTATVTVPSTSSLGAVGYRFTWTCTPSCGTADGATVPASSTTKGQTWTVHVTPFVDVVDGPAGEASTTVVNSLPTVGYAAFERYDVWGDETVRAFVGRTFDADGDTVATSFAWTVGGVSQSSVIDRLDLGALTAAVGAEVRVVATVSDAEGMGGTAAAGPAIVRPAGGWRPLEPNLSEGYVPLPIWADPARERFLALLDGSLWEYRPDAAHRGWARLAVGTD